MTNTKVPYDDVFIKSNIDFFNTVITLKQQYNGKIIMNYLDKRDDSLYKDINADKLIEKIGDYFDVK